MIAITRRKIWLHMFGQFLDTECAVIVFVQGNEFLREGIVSPTTSSRGTAPVTTRWLRQRK
jgi:hypothetical protein